MRSAVLTAACTQYGQQGYHPGPPGGHSSLENRGSRVPSLYRKGVIVGLRGCFNIGPDLVNVKITRGDDDRFLLHGGWLLFGENIPNLIRIREWIVESDWVKWTSAWWRALRAGSGSLVTLLLVAEGLRSPLASSLCIRVLKEIDFSGTTRLRAPSLTQTSAWSATAPGMSLGLVGTLAPLSLRPLCFNLVSRRVHPPAPQAWKNIRGRSRHSYRGKNTDYNCCFVISSVPDGCLGNRACRSISVPVLTSCPGERWERTVTVFRDFIMTSVK